MLDVPAFSRRIPQFSLPDRLGPAGGGFPAGNRLVPSAPLWSINLKNSFAVFQIAGAISRRHGKEEEVLKLALAFFE